MANAIALIYSFLRLFVYFAVMDDDMKVGWLDDVADAAGGRRRRRHDHAPDHAAAANRAHDQPRRQKPGSMCASCRLPICACVPLATPDLGYYYEDMVVRNDVNYANTKAALEIVEEFIIERKLILIGGMGIDMALKLMGRPGIYLNEKLPDYDFLSPDTVADASELARRLCRAGMTNVSAINAYHTTTIRVRVNFVSVADLGYCPKVVFDTIPTLDVGRLRVIHPHFQIADIHHAMCYPFERMFMPVAFYRWKKDCVRYDLLTSAYPVECDNCDGARDSEPAMTDVDLGALTRLLTGRCLAGWAALSYWKTKAAGAGVASSAGGSSAHVTVPAGERIQVYADDFESAVAEAEAGTVVYYEGRLGQLPPSATCTVAGIPCEIFDNFGALLSAEEGGSGMWIANLQQCMLFLLAKLYLYRDSKPALKALCRRLYGECVTMCSHAEIPGLMPSAHVYGERALDDAYLIQRRKFVARIQGERLSSEDSISGAYPARPACEANIKFSYADSPYFRISGAEATSHVPRVLVGE
jgi:hypothetical protein